LNTPLSDINQVLEELDHLYLKHAIYFHHPDYLAHLNCPVMLTSLLAELFSSSINTAVETWDQSAGATLIEQKVIDWTCQRI
ncbi:pyridoxal-dependent decarboxylase, partial [Streptomyces galilaeus]